MHWIVVSSTPIVIRQLLLGKESRVALVKAAYLFGVWLELRPFMRLQTSSLVCF